MIFDDKNSPKAQVIDPHWSLMKISFRPNYKTFIPFLIILCSAFLLILFIKFHQNSCPTCFHLRPWNPAVIKHYILNFGPWALTVYIALYALNTVSLLPPIAALSLAAGYIFGTLWGTIAMMVGAFFGTTVTFYISRVFGRKIVEPLIKGRVKDFEEKVNQNGFMAILFIRLIPIIPWEIMNYAAGLTRISYKDYILATLIGIIPSVVIQTSFTESLTHFDIHDIKVLIPIGGFILLISLPVLYVFLRKKS